MTARHHHYVPQGYLRGFTKGNAKKSRLTVCDLVQRKSFETIPRNVGGKRDFNRVDLPGVDPNAVETALAPFEQKAARALKSVASGKPFDGDDREVILNLIALLSVRSPAQREHWREFETGLMERMLDISLSSEERWEQQRAQMVEAGYAQAADVTYDDVRQFFDSKAYTIELATAHHIKLEMVGVDAVLPTLAARKWTVLHPTDDAGPLITSDHPVMLWWDRADEIPPIYRNSPGYGMTGTTVYFPLAANVGLIGSFEGRSGTVSCNRKMTASLNSSTLMFANRQIYAPKLSFNLEGKNGELLSGSKLLASISS